MTEPQVARGQDPVARSVPRAIWEVTGITEHMGGSQATQRLLQLCRVTQGQTVIDIGCGTGITACFLARTYGARVVAVDFSARSVAEARRRVAGEGLAGLVTVLQADAQCLPLAAATFDLAVLESVAVFCDIARLSAEVWRVLKPGGAFADNELTLVLQDPHGLASPPAELETLLAETLGIRARQEAGWRGAWASAGFDLAASEVQRISLRARLVEHLRTEGLRDYLSAASRALSDRRIRRAFISRSMLRAAGRFRRLVGFGLYVGWKAADQNTGELMTEMKRTV